MNFLHYVLQAVAAGAVVFANIYFDITDNGMVIGATAFSAAYGASMALTWLVGLFRRTPVDVPRVDEGQGEVTRFVVSRRSELDEESLPPFVRDQIRELIRITAEPPTIDNIHHPARKLEPSSSSQRSGRS